MYQSNVRPSAELTYGVRMHVLCAMPHLPMLLETALVNSEGFLAEVFHPWVRWEGPGSGFENSSGGGAGGGVWAQVGGSKLGPRGWAQAGPKWVGPSWAQVGQKSGFFQTSFFCGFLKK